MFLPTPRSRRSLSAELLRIAIVAGATLVGPPAARAIGILDQSVAIPASAVVFAGRTSGSDGRFGRIQTFSVGITGTLSQACLMLPTAGVGVETQLREPQHREALDPSLRAFNRWLAEDWGYGRDGRIYGAPLDSLLDLGEAIAELERLLAKGARFVVLTTGPVDGRSPADPHFDPFWARCQESGINVVYHIGRTPFREIYNTAWGLRPHPPSHRHSLMEYALSFTDRPIADTLTELVADNFFGRFPALELLSIEYGSSWVAPLVHKLDHIARLFSLDLWRFGKPPLSPSETFRQNVWVAPFFEDDVPRLVQALGAEHVLNGSDYPHPEGLLWPVEFVEELEGLPADAQCAGSCGTTSRSSWPERQPAPRASG